VITTQEKTVSPMREEPLRVALVDDSDLIRCRLAEMLGEICGVEIVAEAATADDGVELIRLRQPDLVVLDMRMPGASGISVLERLAHQDERPSFIVFTNYPHPAYRERCTELGVDLFLDKSFDLEQLKEIVERMAS